MLGKHDIVDIPTNVSPSAYHGNIVGEARFALRKANNVLLQATICFGNILSSFAQPRNYIVCLPSLAVNTAHYALIYTARECFS